MRPATTLALLLALSGAHCAVSLRLAGVERVAYLGADWITRGAEHHPATEEKLE